MEIIHFTKTHVKINCFIGCMTRSIILLQPTIPSIVFKQRNKLCYNVLVYNTVHCSFKENRAHYSTTRYGTPHSNFLTVLGSFLKDMKIWRGPNSRVLTIKLLTYPFRWNHASSLEKTRSSSPIPVMLTNDWNLLQYTAFCGVILKEKFIKADHKIWMNWRKT